MNSPTEHDEQVAVIQYCTLRNIPVFAIPNGGHRNIITATRLKAEGVMPGVPDLFFPVPRLNFHGFFLEMKRRKQSRITEEQSKWLDFLNKNGYYVEVAYGADEAIKLINTYFKL